MTVTEIIQATLDGDAVEDVYEALRGIREERYRRITNEASEAKATIRIIKKLTKDKVVQDILAESENKDGISD